MSTLAERQKELQRKKDLLAEEELLLAQESSEGAPFIPLLSPD
jgi:hypothetical protein